MVVIACACGRGRESDLHQHEESPQQEDSLQHEDAASQSTLFTNSTLTHWRIPLSNSCLLRSVVACAG